MVEDEETEEKEITTPALLLVWGADRCYWHGVQIDDVDAIFRGVWWHHPPLEMDL